MKRAVKLFPLLGVVLLALSTQACSSYSYYDLDLKLGSGFDVVKIGSIQFCHMFVTGSVSDDFEVRPEVCKLATTGEIGQVEYSTFADSGSLTFTFKLFQNPQSNPACELGEGAIVIGLDVLEREVM